MLILTRIPYRETCRRSSYCRKFMRPAGEISFFGQGFLLLSHGASFVILSCWHGSIISLLSAKNCGLNWPKPVLMKRLTGIVFINNALLKRTGNSALMRPKPAAGMFWPSIANAGFCSDADNSGCGLRALPEFVFS